MRRSPAVVLVHWALRQLSIWSPTWRGCIWSTEAYLLDFADTRRSRTQSALLSWDSARWRGYRDHHGEAQWPISP